MEISKETRAVEIVSYIAGQLHLTYHHDFKIFLIDSLHNYRLLDDDEVVYKAFHDEAKNEGIITGMFNKVE
jgi:hypothetical protein